MKVSYLPKLFIYTSLLTCCCHRVLAGGRGSCMMGMGGGSKGKGGKGMMMGGGPPPVPPHPNPSKLTIPFPSEQSTIVKGSVFDNSLLIPRLLAPLYPDFDGPHYIKSDDSYENGCKYGIDKIDLTIPIDTKNMLNDNMIGLTVSINGISVAEESVYGDHGDAVHFSDVIFPPILDEKLELKIDVALFDGKIESSYEIPPSGISLLSTGGVLILNCASPFPIKGYPINNGEIVPTKKPETIGILPSAPDDDNNNDYYMKKCKCNKHPVQVLPSTVKIEEIYPKTKKFDSCNNYSSLFLPLLVEPFQDIIGDDVNLQDVFYLYGGNKLKVDTSAYYSGKGKGKGRKHNRDNHGDDNENDNVKNIDELYNVVCGGRGQYGTVRMTGCECGEDDDVPIGFDPFDMTFDFTVYCPW